ncbi:cation diffusion facilitator family transporter [Streptococcus pluranimalium]|uniref:cation diffusion facilitator family transporter n=1 Tax=Streptococcus hyovaginalis TaxID=149015 RepID=UPI00147943C7|nr:cation diffusion facilitator family transporter [Streptococcus hyovaginalis]MDY3025123.1 cation diffusion facilitator family transporter [Streptococcus hyovaginalis]MDY4511336.1 cation diffusion facilitator family transporter [Streptococcus hyovaginalis]MDY5974364.1 cation diffusion facilitator family transporter [Streptococcus hyovaginalis]
MSNPSENLRLAKRGPILSISAYLFLTIGKLIFGYLLDSSSLIADGFNNLSDIVGNVALLIGLHLASQPADEDHRFGHWKIEDLSSLITSFIMFLVGFQVLIQTIQKILSGNETSIDPLGAIVGLVSAMVMFSVYFYNKRLSKKVKSSALVAASKDNLSDALTSLGTSVAIIATSLHFPIIDQLVAIIITFFILKTAYDIFMEATFSLSDGFDQSQLRQYETAILEIPKIAAVKSQRGRTYGSNIYLDIVLEMNPDLSVYESHDITEQVEKMLSERFSVYDIDIHVEPAAIPEDEIIGNVVKKLYKNEMIILSKIPDFEQYISENFFMIEADGQILNKDQVINQKIFYPANFTNFQVQNISQKTKLLTYTLENKQHMSLWRRNEKWYLIYHQITKIDHH